MAKQNLVRRRIAGRVACCFLGLTGRLPLRVCRALGAVLGWIGYWIVPRVRRVGMANLNIAYGDSISPAAKRRILRGAMTNAATVAAEFSHLATMSRAELSDRVRMRGETWLQENPGSLLLAAHFGNWEWMAPVLSARGYPLAEIVRPLDDPSLNAFVDRVRRAHGVETIDKNAAGARVFQAMRDGTFVGILIDQSPRDGGVPVTFFGASCWATVAPAMVALRSRVPILFVSMTREAGHYILEVHPPLHVHRTGALLDDLIGTSQACQDRIEAIVRERPDHWLWLHRRWKPRPRLEAEWQARLDRQKPSPAHDQMGLPGSHS